MAEPYPLESLLSVRRFREDGAKRDLTRSQQHMREAKEACEAKQSEIEQYRIWRVKEEDRRYEAFLGKPTNVGGIERFNAGIAALAAEEITKTLELDQLRKQESEAKKQLEQAQEGVRLARKNTAKIEVHKEIWSEEARKEAERAEDLELEEFKTVLRQGAQAEGEDQ